MLILLYCNGRKCPVEYNHNRKKVYSLFLVRYELMWPCLYVHLSLAIDVDHGLKRSS